jgi:hypothetical protein
MFPKSKFPPKNNPYGGGKKSDGKNTDLPAQMILSSDIDK